MKNPIAVMQMTDTLAPGGAERLAVNIANQLGRNGQRVFFCTTRREGPLATVLAPEVRRIRLARKNRFDLQPLRRLVEFIRTERIQIIHAHSTTLFLASLARLFPPYPALLWHDHFGFGDIQTRPAWLYRCAVADIGGVIAVNESLAHWSRATLHVPPHRVWYVRNFVDESGNRGQAARLPGTAGKRIVCVANFRPQKDHQTLLRALTIVLREEPQARLFLVGHPENEPYFASIQSAIDQLGLREHVSILGSRTDIFDILKSSDIGVLSSRSEGLPLALIEYGKMALPSVATRVGQCHEVMEDGAAGLLVPPAAPEKLAEALIALLRSPERRSALGQRFKFWVDKNYSPESAIAQIFDIYKTLVDEEAA